METKQTTPPTAPALDFGKLAHLIHKHTQQNNTLGSEEETAIDHIDSLINYLLEQSTSCIGIVKTLYPAIMYYLRNSSDSEAEKDKVQMSLGDLIDNAKIEYYYGTDAYIVCGALSEITEEYENKRRQASNFNNK